MTSTARLQNGDRPGFMTTIGRYLPVHVTSDATSGDVIFYPFNDQLKPEMLAMRFGRVRFDALVHRYTFSFGVSTMAGQ